MQAHLLQSSAAQRQALAYRRWQLRGQPLWDADSDWETADRVVSNKRLREKIAIGDDLDYVLWEAWAKDVLRAYISLEVARDPLQLADSLKKVTLPAEVAGQVTFLCAVLDGAPEFGFECYRTHSSNGVRPEELIEAKDASFYRYCCSSFSLYGAFFLDPITVTKNMPPHPALRAYQDGCVVAFAGPESFFAAVTASIHLRQQLRADNEKDFRHWKTRLYARVSVGESCDSVVHGLSFAWRDEIAIPPSSLARLTKSEQKLLLADGIRVGV